MNHLNFLFLYLLLLPAILFAQATDIQTIRKNLVTDALELGFTPRTERYISSDFNKAGDYLQEMNEDGSWSDVDYQDRDNKWAPLIHLDKMLVMTISYSRYSSRYYLNGELLEGLERALKFWYRVNPICDNWYKNRIAKQFYFNIIGLLLQGKVDESLHSKIINDLTLEPTMTGSNRTLLAISTFYRGVLQNDSAMIRSGVTAVTDQVVVTPKEGIQPDYSFHQHGAFIYNGSYGSNFLRESIWMATIVHDTHFAFSKEQIAVLRNYFLEGTRWMLRGGLFDYNVRGRQVGRADAALYGNVLLPQLDHFIIADPKFHQEYQKAIKSIKSKTPQDLIGNRHFWRSDYTVHHRPKYFTSLKMCSKRTVGIELNMNSENKLGYWLPYGLTYICRRGNEYDKIFPVWDWAMLPGVTNPHIEIEEFKVGVAHTQKTEFVGGVSDGHYGISVMDFSKQNTRAKKAWFWFDREWVALGAGIASDHESEVITGINQARLHGPIYIDGEILSTTKQGGDPHWIWHDSVGYFFPAGGNINIKAENQQGNMQRVYGLGQDSVYTADVFSLWFDHGEKPRDKSYAYVIIPGTNREELAKYSSNTPIYTIANTPQVQAIYHKELQIFGIIFHTAGELKVEPDLTVQVDHPSMILINIKSGRVSLSDPTAMLEALTIVLTWNGKSHVKKRGITSWRKVGKERFTRGNAVVNLARHKSVQSPILTLEFGFFGLLNQPAPKG